MAAMEMIVWLLAGGALGWLGCAYLHWNAERGVAVSALIGSAGALLGGKAIAPMFVAGTASGTGFSPDALLIAAAAAAVCLFAGHLLLRRFGV
ncbi:MAG TPA: hypothetical protein VGP97_09855 [Burkholderiales bacterium]|jgi:uncharacterized membrane protein YeaQ/YmgE (transglycosylase-associated protein family)|nr:hypothetical protein [Burkholderiales bacterium]